MKTTHSVFSNFLKPGSINFKNKDLMIPERIRDFLRLTVRLRIRYAWVDSLCIVQDGEDLQEQLNRMAAISASIYITVIGEGIDANHRFLGVDVGPRDTPCLMLRLPDMTCVFKTTRFLRTGPRYGNRGLGHSKRVCSLAACCFLVALLICLLGSVRECIGMRHT